MYAPFQYSRVEWKSRGKEVETDLDEHWAIVTQHMYDVALKDLQEWPILCSVSVRTKSGASLYVASQVPLEKDRRAEPALSTAFEPGGRECV